MQHYHNRNITIVLESEHVPVWPDLTGFKLICQNKFTSVQKMFLFFKNSVLVSEHLFTISGDVQFYQLYKVGYFWWKPLDLIVTQAKFS